MFRLYNAARSILQMGPREYMRQQMGLPIVKFVHETVDIYKSRTKTGVNSIRDILFRGTVVALITAVLVWLSIIMYVAFYYAYVPAISHERPVFLKFRSCGTENSDHQSGHKNLCGYPAAHITLSKRQQLLMLGQPYKIHLEIDMPESPTNKDLGMFMVCADFHGLDGTVLANSCRSTMLHYRSFLLEVLQKVTFSPMFLFGAAEEKQTIHVELFSDYQEHDSQPVTDIYVEIQTTHIEIYSARFLINAHFTGLRHVMFHWPILSAAVGITSNLFFIAFICMISWYQIIHSEEYLNYIDSQLGKDKKFTENDSSSSEDPDDVSLLKDDVEAEYTETVK